MQEGGAGLRDCAVNMRRPARQNRGLKVWVKSKKKMLARILVSAVLFAAGFFLPLAGWSQLVFYLTVYAIIGWDIVWKAVRNIAHGQVFDENFLMALATIGAFCLQEFPEAVEVMLFYQVGELFQSYAVGVRVSPLQL